jgi:hypothetical protein
MFSLLALQCSVCWPFNSAAPDRPLPLPHCYAPGIMHTSRHIVVTLSNIKLILFIRIFKSCDCTSCKRKRLAQTKTHFLTYDTTQSRTALSAEVFEASLGLYIPHKKYVSC